MKKQPDTEPTAHLHGTGWRGLLDQAEYLEANLNATHVLAPLDPETGAPMMQPIALTTPEEVLLMAALLREKAQEWRNALN
jgi:hypothetical protein